MHHKNNTFCIRNAEFFQLKKPIFFWVSLNNKCDKNVNFLLRKTLIFVNILDCFLQTKSNKFFNNVKKHFLRSPWPQSMSSKRIHLRAWPVRPQGKCENDSVQNFLQIWRWLGSGGWRSSWKFIKKWVEFHVRVFNIKWHWMWSGGKHIRKHIHVRRIVNRSCRPRST